ncbi:MAG: DUF501 domain-containing protein [Acidimicrobiales bacterium]
MKPVATASTGPGGSHGDDERRVEALLGRPLDGDFEVVVRAPDGAPVVIANSPVTRKGTPMPTRWWLVDTELRRQVSRLESAGGVSAAEREIDPAAIAASHARHQELRDQLLDPDWTGPRPTGGVAGTRQGVKCLHAHLAWALAGGDDPVGRWVADRLGVALPAGAPTAAVEQAGRV